MQVDSKIKFGVGSYCTSFKISPQKYLSNFIISSKLGWLIGLISLNTNSTITCLPKCP